MYPISDAAVQPLTYSCVSTSASLSAQTPAKRETDPRWLGVMLLDFRWRQLFVFRSIPPRRTVFAALLHSTGKKRRLRALRVDALRSTMWTLEAWTASVSNQRVLQRDDQERT